MSNLDDFKVITGRSLLEQTETDAPVFNSERIQNSLRGRTHEIPKGLTAAEIRAMILTTAREVREA